MNYRKPSKKAKIWGLFSTDSEVPVPLKCLDISIRILGNVARVFYTQVYHNSSSFLLESEFFFPISPDACFDNFEAKFNEITIRGVIKEKQQAKEEYKEAISQGKTAAYTEINEETGDIMKVLLGNIPPKTDISITYSYIQKLDTVLNKFWCFRLFSTITSRYTSDLNEMLKADIAILSSYPTISADKSEAYPWNIKVEIESPSPIKFLKSPSHEIFTTYGNERHTCSITLNHHKKHHPNKDFILMYSNGKEDKPDYLLTPFEDGYCAMVTFLADFDKKSLEETYNNFAKQVTTEEVPTMDMVKGEYIFLIDRSGSMSGQRIIVAKQSLLVCLKSLPEDSYFNVVSFGSSYNFLNNESQKYTPKTLQNCIREVCKFTANMGGTEIFSSLNKIFKTPVKKGYPRFLFLITDGGVANTTKVLELIENNNEKARVFTIGIGNGCSPELIVRGAAYGRGKHEFVANNEEIYEKVMSLLNASMTPCYFDLSFEAQNFDAVVKSVSPNPASLHFLLNGQPATFFVFLRKEAFENDQKTMPLKLRFYDTQIKGYRTLDLTLDAKESLENPLISKLGVHDMIKRLEAANEKTQEALQVLWLNKNDIKKELLDLSLKYSILCKATAFFCEIAANQGENLKLEQAAVTVPTILSQDYSHYLPRGAGIDQGYIDLGYARAASKGGACCDAGIGGGGSNYQPPDYSAETKPFENIESGFNSGSFVGSKSKMGRHCLTIIMKQNFEGFWDPKDKELNFIIIKTGSLPNVPNELGVITDDANKIWITILVLLWLEMACEGEKKIWLLVYQKGRDWLNKKGINYEEVKHLGTSVVKAE